MVQTHSTAWSFPNCSTVPKKIGSGSDAEKSHATTTSTNGRPAAGQRYETPAANERWSVAKTNATEATYAATAATTLSHGAANADAATWPNANETSWPDAERWSHDAAA